jgi:hypothetical protein
MTASENAQLVADRERERQISARLQADLNFTREQNASLVKAREALAADLAALQEAAGAAQVALEWVTKGEHHSACPIPRGKGQTTIVRDDCTCQVKAAREALPTLAALLPQPVKATAYPHCRHCAWGKDCAGHDEPCTALLRIGGTCQTQRIKETA